MYELYDESGERNSEYPQGLVANTVIFEGGPWGAVFGRLDPLIHINIYIYIYIYILGSNARFARADAYGTILWDDITGLYYGIISQDNITE